METPQQQPQGASGSPVDTDAVADLSSLSETSSSHGAISQPKGDGDHIGVDGRGEIIGNIGDDIGEETIGDDKMGGDKKNGDSNPNDRVKASSTEGDLPGSVTVTVIAHSTAPSSPAKPEKVHGSKPVKKNKQRADKREDEGEPPETIIDDEEGDGRSEAAIKEAEQRRLYHFDTCQGLTALRIIEFNENEKALRKAERDSEIDEAERKVKVARLEREEDLRRNAERAARIEESERRARAARRRMWQGRLMLAARLSFPVFCAALVSFCAHALDPWVGGYVRTSNELFRRSVSYLSPNLPPSLLSSQPAVETEPEEVVPPAWDAWALELEDILDGPWV